MRKSCIYASRAEVGSCVFLCESKKPNQAGKNFTVNGWINLELTKINRSIKVGKDGRDKTSRFISDSGINLKNAKIIGSLEWSEVELDKKTGLIFHGATVGHLIASTGQHSRTEETWPKLYLDGFVYNNIEFKGLNKKAYTTYLNWLKKQEAFNPQTYEQLAAVLRQNGQEADAIKISIQKEKIRHKSGGWYWWLDPIKWLWRLIGYGYRVERALIGALIVIFFGWIIFNAANHDHMIVPTEEKTFTMYVNYYREQYNKINEETLKTRKSSDIERAFKKYNNDPQVYDNKNPLPLLYPEFHPLVYSIDVFLPIDVDLQQHKKWEPYAQTNLGFMLEIYLWFHAIMGWVLITLGLAGLAGLIRRS